jgi:LysR family hydrogen peroxide-inducible transcriptional activator
LRYFLAVAETGSFTAAAERCAVAQPSLSQQIAKLEQRLGVPLFDRLPRGAVLTEAGERLRPDAERILAAVDDARQRVVESKGEVAGRLALGAIPTIAPFLLPRVLKRYARRYPQVELQVQEDVTEVLIDRLAAGGLDVAVMSLPIEHQQLHAERLFDEPLLLAVHPDHRLARRKRVRWDDLTDERFLVLREMHCLGNQVMSFCKRNRAVPDVAFRGSQIATILKMVGLGFGVSLIPAMAARADTSSRRVYREITADPPRRAVAVAWHLHRYRTNAARAFVQELQREANARVE